MGKEIIRERSCELKGVKRETGDGTSDQTLIHLTMGPHGVSRHFLEHENADCIPRISLQYFRLDCSCAGHEWTP
jgi:hypothetical protein